MPIGSRMSVHVSAPPPAVASTPLRVSTVKFAYLNQARRPTFITIAIARMACARRRRPASIERSTLRPNSPLRAIEAIRTSTIQPAPHV